MRRIASLAVLAVAASVAAAPSAAADSWSPTVGCYQTYLYTVRQNGEFWLLQHGDAANGTFTWYGDAVRIGIGWGGRTLVRDERLIYNITDSGELRQFQLNGAAFQQLPHGGYYDVVGWDWQLYTTPEYRNRIAFDQEGALYTIDQQGNLRWWFFDVVTNHWHPDSGRVLATGWSQYDMITLAGPGVLQARRPDGTMSRFRYHQASQRWMREGTSSGSGWHMFEKMFSPGGDLLYGINRWNGDLLWYGYDEPSDKWVSDTGRLVGKGWSGLRDVTMNPSACRSRTKLGPEPYVIGGGSYSPPAAFETESGVLHTFQVKNGTTLVHGTMTDPANFRSTSAPGQVHEGALRPYVRDTRAAEVYASAGLDIALDGWAPDGQFAERKEFGGYFGHGPAVHRRSDGTVVLYGVGSGQLWIREGDFPWRALGGTDLGGYATIARASDTSVTLLVRNRNGRLFEVTHTAAGLGQFLEYAGPELFSDGATAIIDSAGVLRVFGDSQPGYAMTAGPDRQWQQIGDQHMSGATAALGVDGRITVVAKDDNGKWARSTEEAPGSPVFGAWQPLDTGDTEPSSDPALITRRSGEIAMLYRYGTSSLRYCAIGSGVSCTTLD